MLDNFHQDMKEKDERRRQANYAGEYRITLTPPGMTKAIVISASIPLMAMVTNGKNPEGRFFAHLRSALLTPDNFDFDAYQKRKGAIEWIAFHEKRLNLRLRGVFRLLSVDDTVEDQFEVTHSVSW